MPPHASEARVRPTPEVCLRAWLDLVDFGTELAVAGIVATRHVSREEALLRLGRRFREEADQMVPALLRMARGKGHD